MKKNGMVFISDRVPHGIFNYKLSRVNERAWNEAIRDGVVSNAMRPMRFRYLCVGDIVFVKQYGKYFRIDVVA